VALLGATAGCSSEAGGCPSPAGFASFPQSTPKSPARRRGGRPFRRFLMSASRWDELERAIRGKDSDAAERLWLELLEQDSGNVEGFLKAADGIAEKAGGRRQAGVLLWMVAGALKDKERDK